MVQKRAQTTPSQAILEGVTTGHGATAARRLKAQSELCGDAESRAETIRPRAKRGVTIWIDDLDLDELNTTIGNSLNSARLGLGKINTSALENAAKSLKSAGTMIGVKYRPAVR